MAKRHSKFIDICRKLDEMNFCNERQFFQLIYNWIKIDYISKRQFQTIIQIYTELGSDVSFVDNVSYQRPQKFYTEGHRNIST